MKKFKEYLGEAFFKVRIPDVAPTFVEADSASQVKQTMRKILKPDVVKELEIERVTRFYVWLFETTSPHPKTHSTFDP